MTVDVGLEHLAEAVRFLHYNVTCVFLFPYCTLWKEVTISSWKLRCGELNSPSLRWSIYINYVEFICMGDLSPLPHLSIYSIVLFIISMDSDISSILWVTFQYYLVCCINFSSFGHWKLFQLAPVLLRHIPNNVFMLLLLALPYFLALRNAQGSSCIFLAPVLESAISLWSLGSFY